MIDTKRVDYFNAYLSSILGAIKDGCNVKGYIAWSLLDSFEWKAGFAEKFGLYHVDFNHPNKTRTAKLSAKVYANIVKTNRIDWDFKPDMGEEELVLDKNSSRKVAQSSIIIFATLLMSSLVRLL